MNFALIGCGRIAANHIEAARNNGLNIAALCDIDLKQCEKLCEKCAIKDDYPKIQFYDNHREMLKNEDLDMVAIATSSGAHAEIALDCLGCDINTLVEKPMAMSMAEADALLEASKKSKGKFGVCHQNRFNKSLQKMRQALEANRFGRLFHVAAHVRWNRGPQYYEQAAWRGTWAEDGGVLMNQCIHNIDLMRWMLGDDLTEVFAFTDNLNHPYIEAEDLGLALFKAANGAYGLLEGTSNVYPRNLEETLYIFGEKGTVKAGGKSVNRIECWRFADNDENEEKAVIDEFSEDVPNIYGFGHTPLYADFIEAVENDRAPLIDAAAGRRALESVLAIYLSAAENRPVKLPLEEKIASTDFSGRFDDKRDKS